MTDPSGPEVPQPPAYQSPPAQSTPPAYAPPVAPAYAAPAPGAPVPGKTLGIVALVVAIFFNVIGLILGIVALVQSRKAGVKNGPAVAAIIVGAVLFVIGLIVVISIVAIGGAALSHLVEICNQYGPGEHVVDGITYTCSS